MVNDVIILENVGFAYPGGPLLLHDVSFHVKRGEVVALVGRTGSGKSTLLNICAGIIPHHQPGRLTGSVRVLGIDTQAATLGALAAVAGVVTQDPENQLFNLFVEDEIAWGMENRGMSVDDMRRRMDAVLDLFKITHLRHRITYDLSGGEKQRVVLAAAHAPDPGLFLLDAPTSQLDPLGSEEVLAGIRALAEQGYTILLVEEKLEELWMLVDRVLLLDGGTIRLNVARDALNDHVEDLEHAGIPLPPLVKLGRLLRDRGYDVPPLPPLPADAASALPVRPPLRSPETPVPTPPHRDRSAPALLRVGGLSYTYPPPRATEALTGINLELPPSSIVAVVGHNGSGKTTLARCISGDLKPTKGFVEINGQNVHALPVRRRAGLVGYVFQNPDHQIFKDPVIEDVAFGLTNLGLPRDQALAVSEQVLRALNLWDVRDVHPFRLSKGDRQRLAIAGVAVMRPSVMIVDEPTTGQDLIEASALMSLLTEMARTNGQTVVVITHAMELVAAYADIVVALNDGEILISGPPQIVFKEEELLRRTFVKPPSVTALGNRLGLDPPPLTLDQAVEALEQALSAMNEVATE